MTLPTPPTCIACSIFRREIEALQATATLDLQFRFLNSMLHMVPKQLGTRLGHLIEEEKKQGHRVVLGFGDCCPQMLELQAMTDTNRTEGINCCEILLGRERYRTLRKEGVFFLLPEWARRWQEIFQTELGLTKANAQSLMGEMHTRLVYLDTGLVPIPEQEMQEASAFTGLPWEVLPVTLETLHANLEKAMRTRHPNE